MEAIVKVRLTPRTRFRSVRSGHVYTFFKMAGHGQMTLANLTQGGLMRVAVADVLNIDLFVTYQEGN